MTKKRRGLDAPELLLYHRIILYTALRTKKLIKIIIVLKFRQKETRFSTGLVLEREKIPLNMFTYIIYMLVFLHNLLSVRL